MLAELVVSVILGIKKVKRTKVGDSEADDISNLGRNVSSAQCEATEDPRRKLAFITQDSLPI